VICYYCRQRKHMRRKNLRAFLARLDILVSDVAHHRGVKADVERKSDSREGTQMTRIRLRAAEEEARGMQEKLEMSTAEIGLTVRTTNCLEEKGIFTVRDLLNCTREDLLSISNFGEKTLEEVYKSLEGVGFFRRNRRPTVVAG
jgi:DNA-directed RNA polymerase subunit alpha